MPRTVASLCVALCAIGFFSCNKAEKTADNAETSAVQKPDSATVALAKQAKSMFGMLPSSMPGSDNDTPEQIALGKKLYFETALSANNIQSCNGCHNIEVGGVDNLQTSSGAFSMNGDRNAPTVYNAGFHIAQFWDGRAKDLAEQAKGPILNPIEMAMGSEEEVIEKLTKIEEYPPLFAVAFPLDTNPLTYDNLANAIAAYERTLITHDRFDEFLSGNYDAITTEEQKGLQTFISTGCISCHVTPTFGGNIYQKMGMVNAYENTEDKGRFAITGEEADMYMFKVPSLRNIALTAPYFHDGAAATLEEAVQQMAWLQLGKELSEEETTSIVTFLHTLSDTTMAKKKASASMAVH
jgi:cytochrome c peroxidase